jgi:PhoPQ-activated pathogenicity-related protein
LKNNKITKDRILKLILQQTKVEEQLINAIKKYSKNKNIMLQELYAQAIKEFINSFKGITPGIYHPIFYSSPITGITVNLKIPEYLKEEAEEIANNKKTSSRRLYYTALLRFSLNNKIISSKEELRNIS